MTGSTVNESRKNNMKIYYKYKNIERSIKNIWMENFLNNGYLGLKKFDATGFAREDSRRSLISDT